MADRLTEIFENCTWKNKVRGPLPEKSSEITYLWREEDAHMAELFFGPAGSAVLKEDHPAVTRSLVLGHDESGERCLVLREVQSENYDIEKMSRGMAELLNADKVMASFKKHEGGE